MMKINDPKEREVVIAAFQNLLVSEGWKLIEQAMDDNIRESLRQLETGINDKNEDIDIDLVRMKLKVYREMRNTPKLWITKLESSEPEVVDPDPFDTVSDVENRKLDK